MEVVLTGKLSTYAGSSRYQIVVEQVELAGCRRSDGPAGRAQEDA